MTSPLGTLWEVQTGVIDKAGIRDQVDTFDASFWEDEHFFSLFFYKMGQTRPLSVYFCQTYVDYT